MQEKFKVEFERVFKDKFILLSKKEILEKEIFGKGNYNEKIDEFVGDYMALAISNYAIEWERDGFEMVGRHAGLTQEEMEVPLIVIDTNEL